MQQHVLEGATYVSTQITSLGTWWLFEHLVDAWAVIEQLVEDDPTRCIMMGRSSILFHGPTSWRGPAVEQLSLLGLRVRAGSVVLVDDVYLELHALGQIKTHAQCIDDGFGSQVRLWQVPLSEDVAWDAPIQTARTNLRWDVRPCLGRQALIDSLFGTEQTARVTYVHGVAGIGKTHMVRHGLTQRLLRTPQAQVWMLSMRALRSVSELATQLSQLWRFRLPDDPSTWSEVLAKRCDVGGRDTWVVIDDLDHLDDEAIEWLNALLEQSTIARWVLLGRGERRLFQARNIELMPLELPISCVLLDQRGLALNEQAMTRLIQWATYCQGNPRSLELLTRALVSVYGTEMTSLEPQPHESPLALAWERLTLQQQYCLLCLGLFKRDFGAEIAHELLMRGLGVDDTHAVEQCFDTLVLQAWVQPMPERDAWCVPDAIRAFIQERSLRHAWDTPQDIYLALFAEKIQSWSAELATENELVVLSKFSDHNHDVFHVMRLLLDQEARWSVSLVVALRNVFWINAPYEQYCSLLQDYIECAQRLDWSSASLLLRATFGIVLARNHSENTMGLTLLIEARAQRDDFPAYLWAESEMTVVSLVGQQTQEHNLAAQRRELGEANYNFCVEHQLDEQASQMASHMLYTFDSPEPGEALLWAQRAQEHAELTRSPSLISRSAFTLHRALLMEGRLEESRAMAHRAYDISRTLRMPHVTSQSLAGLGYVELCLKNFEHAKRHLHAGLALTQENVLFFEEANLSFILGMTYLCDNQARLARRYFEEVKASYGQSPIDIFFRVCQAWVGACYVFEGMYQTGEQQIREVKAFFEENDVISYLPTIEMLALVPQIYHAGCIEPDREKLDALRTQHQQILTTNLHIEDTVVTLCLELAEQSFEQSPTQVLEVSSDMMQFRVSGEEAWVDIRRRKALRLIFAALIRARQQRASETILAQELFEVGWPGEQPEIRSGMMRLYVAISTLRKLGLSDMLETVDDGYRLDPNVLIKQHA